MSLHQCCVRSLLFVPELVCAHCPMPEHHNLMRRTVTACAACRQAAEQARQQLAASSQQEQQLAEQVRRVRTTCAGLKAESNSAASANAVVKALMEARASGEIPGVYGRLGDLGAIDAK